MASIIKRKRKDGSIAYRAEIRLKQKEYPHEHFNYHRFIQRYFLSKLHK